MRILLNTKPMVFSNKTGVGYYVSNLYRSLREYGTDVIPTNGKTASLIDVLGKISTRVKRSIGMDHSPFLRMVGDNLAALVLREGTPGGDYDLYHETTFDPLPETKQRLVCNIYDLSFIRFPGYFTEGFAEESKRNISKNVSIAERVIVNSGFIKDEAISLLTLPEGKIDIIPLAASAGYYSIKKPSERPRELRHFTDKEYILFVGTVEPRKNLKILMQAFKEVRTRYDLSLVICGGFGWLSGEIISYAKEMDVEKDVIFTNYVEELTLSYLYNFASVFVYPSIYEGFGIPPLEAMACGTPVIISDIPPLKEVAGDAALSFNPNYYEELSFAIDKALSSESLRSELREKGRRKAEQYSWRKVAAETVKTYQKALAN
jgi:glycosyltransferase involved in cell wall biosynthesis